VEGSIDDALDTNLTNRVVPSGENAIPWFSVASAMMVDEDVMHPFAFNLYPSFLSDTKHSGLDRDTHLSSHYRYR